MSKKQGFGKFIMLLPVLTLLIANVPGAGLVKAYAEETEKTIACLGTAGIANPTIPLSSSTAWQGSYVYYGKYDDTAMKFRVLDSASTEFGGKTMLLDCDSVLFKKTFDYEGGTNIWENSNINSVLNGSLFFTKEGVFTEVERNAIAASIKEGKTKGKDGSGGLREDYAYSLAYAPLTGQRIFLLDAVEATRTSYGYEDFGISDNFRNVSYTRQKRGDTPIWWLRSQNCVGNDIAGCVSNMGEISRTYVWGNYGVSPVFNVNLSSVIFSSVIPSESGSYKLTLRDNNLKVSANNITRNGKSIKVPCTVTDDTAGNVFATQVSVLMTNAVWSDSGWNIGEGTELKYVYTKLDNDNSFMLPTGYDSSWNVYIFAEQVNAGKATDYASAPVKIELPSHTHNWKYKENGATITASCTEDCDISTSLTLTLSAPGSEVVYDGNTHACTINTDYNTIAFGEGPYTIYYEGECTDGTVWNSAQAPVKAGSYTAKVSAGTGSGKATAQVSFTIKPKSVTAVVTAVDRNYEAGEITVDLQAGKVSDAVFGDDVTVDITGASAEMADENAGDHKPVTISGVKLGGSAADNYALPAQPYGVTVNIKKTADPAVITKTAEVIRGGNTVDLSKNVSSNVVGSVSYAIDEDISGCTLSGSVLKSGKDAGTCKVNVTISDSTNHTGRTETITVTVNEKKEEELSVTQENGIYGEELTDPVYIPPEETIADALISYSGKVWDGTDYGPVSDKPVQTGNYTVTVTEETIDTIYTGSGKFVIAVKPMTVAAENATVTYDGKTHGITVAVTDPADGYTITYGTEDGTYDLTESHKISKVGESPLTVYYQVTADNYDTYTGSATITINKADSTVTPPKAKRGLAASGSAQELIEAGSVDGGKMLYAVTTKNEEPTADKFSEAIPSGTEAGTYYVWYKTAGDADHADTGVEGIPVTIAPAPEKETQKETEKAADKDKGPSFYPLCVRQKKVTDNSITLAWKKVKGAKSYTIYGCPCGKDEYKELKTVKGTSFTQKKLDAGRYYKYFVRANSGKKAGSGKVAESVKLHIATSGKKNGNPVSVSVTKKSLRLKKGKTAKIKAKVKEEGRVKYHYPKLAYESDNPEVAKVNKKGRVTAVSKGSCTIYVYTQNGLYASVKITV